MIEEAVIMKNVELFLDALNNYRVLSDELVTKLANKLNYPTEEISEYWKRDLEKSVTKGNLDENWDYWFHGVDCRFRNKISGQVVDVKLGNYRATSTLPDPYFFTQYIHTSNDEIKVAKLLVDKINDATKVFDVLIKKGHLNRD